jgi:hypothetical protein
MMVSLPVEAVAGGEIPLPELAWSQKLELENL